MSAAAGVIGVVAVGIIGIGCVLAATRGGLLAVVQGIAGRIEPLVGDDLLPWVMAALAVGAILALSIAGVLVWVALR
jgi:hypothetical protein